MKLPCSWAERFFIFQRVAVVHFLTSGMAATGGNGAAVSCRGAASCHRVGWETAVLQNLGPALPGWEKQLWAPSAEQGWICEGSGGLWCLPKAL